MQAQDVLLQYKLEAGQEYYLDIDINQNTHSETINQEELNMFSHLLLRFRADSISLTGTCHFTVSYEDLHLSVLSPALGLDIDSRSRKNPDLSILMDSLLMLDFNLGMSRWGEMIYLEGLTEFFAGISSDSSTFGPAASTVEEAYGTHAFENLFSVFVSYLPGLQSSRNWTRDVIYYFNTKPVKMVNRYQLARSDPGKLVVQGIGMINSMQPYRESLPIGMVESSVSGSQTYDYSVDPDSGWLRQCMSRQRLVIETRILESSSLPRNLKIPSYTETVFEVRGYASKERK